MGNRYEVEVSYEVVDSAHFDIDLKKAAEMSDEELAKVLKEGAYEFARDNLDLIFESHGMDTIKESIGYVRRHIKEEIEFGGLS